MSTRLLWFALGFAVSAVALIAYVARQVDRRVARIGYVPAPSEGWLLCPDCQCIVPNASTGGGRVYGPHGRTTFEPCPNSGRAAQ